MEQLQQKSLTITGALAARNLLLRTVLPNVLQIVHNKLTHPATHVMDRVAERRQITVDGFEDVCVKCSDQPLVVHQSCETVIGTPLTHVAWCVVHVLDRRLSAREVNLVLLVFSHKP